MELLIDLLLPSVLLPVTLSAIAWRLTQHYSSAQWILAIVWLPSYVWLVDRPNFPPVEATDWLWGLVALAIVINLLFRHHLSALAALQTLLLSIVLIAIAWPVVLSDFSLVILFVGLSVLVVAYLMFERSTKQQPATPMFVLLISSAGLGLFVAIEGSLLIGQLAGALSASLFGFALFEIFHKSKYLKLNSLHIIPVIQAYLAILTSAYLFTELPVGPTSLLLIAPLAGFVFKRNYAYISTILFVIAAISWLLLGSNLAT